MGGSFVRIFALLWADILVGYAFFVMQTYLTDVWGLSFTNSAAIMNIFSGICLILPVFFLFFVDAVFGNFVMLFLSSICYSVGIVCIFMSTPPVLGNSTGTCDEYESNCIGRIQKVLFYTGMALVAVGVSGNEVSVKPFLVEQNPEGQLRVRKPCQLPGFILIVITPIVGAIALPYITSWSIRFIIPAICTVIATLLFLSGSWSYTKKDPKGSPITNVCRVYVAFAANIFKQRPLDNRLYERGEELQRFTYTRCLRCLEKATIDVPAGEVRNRWRVCSVAEVEEAKTAIRMIPMWLTFIVCGIISSIGNSYFVEQADNMNRRIGKWNLPPQILLLFYRGSRTLFDALALRFLLGKKETTDNTTPTVKTPCDGIRSAVGIGIAMVFSVLCSMTSASIELKRLKVIRNHGLLDKPDDDIPMSVYWLLFQFLLLAGLDSFFEKSVGQFYECQAPGSMKNYLEHFTKFVFGLGYMFNVLTVYIVGQVSQRGERRNWFQHTLSSSRLDRYYWVLAALGAVNFVLFIMVASLYRYQKLEASVTVNAEIEGPQVDAGDVGGGTNNQDAGNTSGDGNGGGGPLCCC